MWLHYLKQWIAVVWTSKFSGWAPARGFMSCQRDTTVPLFSFISKHFASAVWSACLVCPCWLWSSAASDNICLLLQRHCDDTASLCWLTYYQCTSLCVESALCLGIGPLLCQERQRLTGMLPSWAAWRHPASACLFCAHPLPQINQPLNTTTICLWFQSFNRDYRNVL